MNSELLSQMEDNYQLFINTKSLDEKIYILGLVNELSNIFDDNLKLKLIKDKLIMRSLLFSNKMFLMQAIDENNKYDYVTNNIDSILESINMERKKRVHIAYINFFPSLKPKEIEFILNDFFSQLSSSLYEFYLNLKKSSIFVSDRCEEDGKAFILSPRSSNTFVVIRKLANYLDLSILIHEIGHAYYNAINNVNLDYINVLDNDIKGEIPSRLLELFFIDYLMNNNCSRCANILKNKYRNFLNIERYKLDDYRNLKYYLGNYLAFKLKDNNQGTIEELFKLINNNTLNDLLKNKEVKVFKR